MTYLTFPHRTTPIQATEAVLDRIYAAANLGLKGDTLALAAGMTPLQFNRLCENDPMAQMAALKGKADGEMLHARMLSEASHNGDSKASLAILQHAHGWTAKQEIDIKSEHSIDIKSLLAERAARIFDVTPEVVDAN
jgi:hypothetical protein